MTAHCIISTRRAIRRTNVARLRYKIWRRIVRRTIRRTILTRAYPKHIVRRTNVPSRTRCTLRTGSHDTLWIYTLSRQQARRMLSKALVMSSWRLQESPCSWTFQDVSVISSWTLQDVSSSSWTFQESHCPWAYFYEHVDEDMQGFFHRIYGV